MNTSFEFSFLAIGAFWVAVQTILGAINFVNDMRETIVTGQRDGVSITLKHRYAIRFDWILSMGGMIAILFMFSTVIFLISHAEASNLGQNVSLAMALVGASAFLAGILFVMCGISDYRLIQYTLRNTASKRSL